LFSLPVDDIKSPYNTKFLTLAKSHSPNIFSAKNFATILKAINIFLYPRHILARVHLTFAPTFQSKRSLKYWMQIISDKNI
jgi:hypothetical protein